MTGIPTISLRGGTVDHDRGHDQEIASELITAYSTIGFAQIIDTGLDPQLRHRVFEASKQFHAQPLETKQTIALDARHRGYIAMASSTDRNSSVDTVTEPNRSESFMMLREDAPDDPDVLAGSYLAGPNQWPADAAGFSEAGFDSTAFDSTAFRRALEAYHAELSTLGRRVLTLFEIGLGVPNGAIVDAFAKPTTWLRLLHYPPVERDAASSVFGSAPHRDFGALTLLAQDDVGGLSVRAPDGSWLDVLPREDALVVNVGDMLHRWTNGMLLSTPHRVDNRSGRERYSVPFFYDPHVETEIVPLDACVVATTGTADFEPLQFGSFLRSEIEVSYDRHQPGATTGP